MECAKASVLIVDDHDPNLILLRDLLESAGIPNVDALTDPLPVLMLTADVSREARQEALAAGAKDFLTKPLDGTEVVLRADATRLVLELTDHTRVQDYEPLLLVLDRLGESGGVSWRPGLSPCATGSAPAGVADASRRSRFAGRIDRRDGPGAITPPSVGLLTP